MVCSLGCVFVTNIGMFFVCFSFSCCNLRLDENPIIFVHSVRFLSITFPPSTTATATAPCLFLFPFLVYCVPRALALAVCFVCIFFFVFAI